MIASIDSTGSTRATTRTSGVNVWVLVSIMRGRRRRTAICEARSLVDGHEARLADAAVRVDGDDPRAARSDAALAAVGDRADARVEAVQIVDRLQQPLAGQVAARGAQRDGEDLRRRQRRGLLGISRGEGG